MSVGMIIALEQSANQLKSFTIGGAAFLLLLGTMAALVAFGGGRDHT